MASLASYLGDHADCFAVFGAAVAAYWSIKLLLSLWSGIKTYFLARSLGLSTNLRKMGEWAVVTGATDGIGKAYAHEIAKQGVNIILVSRSPDKLSDVASEIENKFKVKTKCVSVDFTGGKEIYERISKELEGYEVGTLVNNVGMNFGYPQFFGECEEKMVPNIINCNIMSLTMMTKILLPKMAERRKGVVVNISSGSAMKPTPLLSVYSASKAYVDFLSQAVQTEYRSKGIIVQDVLPFFVATKLSKIRKTSFFVPSPTTYAKQAVATIGVQEKTFGCLAHAIQGWVVSFVPESIQSSVAMKMMLGARKAALKKLEKKQ